MKFVNHTATPINLPLQGIYGVEPGDTFEVNGDAADSLVEQGWSGKSKAPDEAPKSPAAPAEQEGE